MAARRWSLAGLALNLLGCGETTSSPNLVSDTNSAADGATGDSGPVETAIDADGSTADSSAVAADASIEVATDACPADAICGGKCILDFSSDGDNCGYCGNACSVGGFCTASTCRCPGAKGLSCSGKCVDADSDRNNCGKCGTACTMLCSSSNCVTASDVAVGHAYACAILSNRTVRCWGRNTEGQLGDGAFLDRYIPRPVPGLSAVSQISLSNSAGTTCARLADGTVRCWGNNLYGQVGDGSTKNSATPADPGLVGVVDIATNERGFREPGAWPADSAPPNGLASALEYACV